MNTDPVIAHLRHLELRGRSPATIQTRRRRLTHVQAAVPVPLLRATPAHLLAWREGLALSPGAVRDCVSHLSQFYKWAMGQDLIVRNPAASLPVPPAPRRLPRPIDDRRLFSAVAAAPSRIRPWLVLAGWAGLRAKEIALLRRESVLDTAAPPLLIVTIDATKGRHERAVPLSPYVLQELHRAGMPAAGWLFPRIDGRPGPNQPWRISSLANQHLHDCGYPETLHQLRHRFGTMAYRATRDLRTVQELLGHAQPGTTAGYAAYDRAEGMAAVVALPVPGIPAASR